MASFCNLDGGIRNDPKNKGCPPMLFLDQARVFTRRWGFLKSGRIFIWYSCRRWIWLGAVISLEMRHGLLLGSWVFSSRELLYIKYQLLWGDLPWKLIFTSERSDQLWDVTTHNGKLRVCFLNATHFCCRILGGSNIWIFRSSPSQLLEQKPIKRAPSLQSLVLP